MKLKLNPFETYLHSVFKVYTQKLDPFEHLWARKSGKTVL